MSPTAYFIGVQGNLAPAILVILFAVGKNYNEYSINAQHPQIAILKS